MVVEELEMLVKEYSPDSFWFVDDVFTMSEGWIHDFQRSLESKNLQISYECITRADKLSEDIIRSLKDTGCQLLWIGAESGSQKVLDLMDRRVKAQQVRDMIRLAGSYGIKTGTFIMLGYPGEEQVDIEETIRHYGQERTPFSMLSRSVAGTIKDTLVLALPGSTNGAKESMDAIFPAVLHSFRILRGARHD